MKTCAAALTLVLLFALGCSDDDDGVASPEVEVEMELLAPDIRHCGATQWSPDGSMIAFTYIPEYGAPKRIGVVPSEGGDVTELPGTTHAEEFTWSPDGDMIAFAPRLQWTHLWMVPVEGGEAVQLTTHDTFSNIYYPQWSPDGRQIAFAANMNSGVGRIHLVPAAGGEAVALFSGRSPRWSPDGSMLAYVDEDIALQIYRVGFGTSVRAIDLAGDMRIPRWSPDGTKIAFKTFVDGSRSSIWAVRVDENGTAFDLHRILDSAYHPLVFDWSPLGDRIVFGTNTHGDYQIWVVGSDEGEPVQLTTYEGEYREYQDPDWSPDGSRIAVASDGVWILKIE